jgi:hypothetical protein
MVRVDAGHPIANSKAAWLNVAGQMRNNGIRVTFVKHNIVDAWEAGGEIYEYGTVDSQMVNASSTMMDEQIAYFMIWRMEGNSLKARFSMWAPTSSFTQTKSTFAKPSAQTKNK